MVEEGLVVKFKADTSGLEAGAKKGEQAVKKFGASTGQAGQAVTSFGRVLQDLPFGPMGVANNLEGAALAMKGLRQESAATGQSIGSILMRQLTGGGGLIAAISLVSAGLSFASVGLSAWTRMFGDAGKEAKKTADEVRNATDAISKSGGEYQKAFESIASLTSQVNLAKEGFLSKKDVVSQYNQTLGDTIGKVSSLDELEKKLATTGQAYIRFTLMKAAANVALGKAAEEAFKAEEKRFAKIDTSQFGRVFNPELNAQQNATANSRIAQLAGKANDKLEGEANRFDQEKDRFSGIADNFLKEAAKLSQEFKFDFFEGEIKPPKIDKEAAQKDYTDIMVRIFREMQLPDLRIAIIPEIKSDDKQAINQFLGGMRRGMEQLSDSEKINASDLFRGEVDFKEFLKNGGETATDIIKRQRKEAEALAETISGVVTPAFQGMFSAILQGENPVKSFFNSLMQGINQLISQLIAAAAQAAIFSLLIPGGGSFGSMFKKILSGARPFAEGGIVSGPTLGFVGEYANAGTDPEIISPLSKLRGMIADVAGGGGGPLVARGNDLVLVHARTNRKQGRVR